MNVDLEFVFTSISLMLSFKLSGEDFSFGPLILCVFVFNCE